MVLSIRRLHVVGPRVFPQRQVQRREIPEPGDAFADRVKDGMTWEELDAKLKEGRAPIWVDFYNLGWVVPISAVPPRCALRREGNISLQGISTLRAQAWSSRQTSAGSRTRCSFKVD